jgi:hypothetical protein
MLEKDHVNQVEVMVRPTQYLGQGSGIVPDPLNQQLVDQNMQKLEIKMESTVKRLIAHFKDNK